MPETTARQRIHTSNNFNHFCRIVTDCDVKLKIVVHAGW